MVPTDQNAIKSTEYEKDPVHPVFAFGAAGAALSSNRTYHSILLVYIWYAYFHSEFTEPFVEDCGVIAQCLDLLKFEVMGAVHLLEILGLLEQRAVPPTGGPLFAPRMISQEVNTVLTKLRVGEIDLFRSYLPTYVENGQAVDFRAM